MRVAGSRCWDVVTRFQIPHPDTPLPSPFNLHHASRGGEGEKAWGIAEMCSARTIESVIPMRARHRMFPPRDGAPAHVPVSEGAGPGVPRKSRSRGPREIAVVGCGFRGVGWWGAD